MNSPARKAAIVSSMLSKVGGLVVGWCGLLPFVRMPLRVEMGGSEIEAAEGDMLAGSWNEGGQERERRREGQGMGFVPGRWMLYLVCGCWRRREDGDCLSFPCIILDFSCSGELEPSWYATSDQVYIIKMYTGKSKLTVSREHRSKNPGRETRINVIVWAEVDPLQ